MSFFKKMPNPISFFKKLYTTWKNKKIYKKIVLQTALSQNKFIKYFSFNAITNLLIALLQSISFFTTLAGANYYLSDITPFAPLAFAICIQLGIILYTMSWENIVTKKIKYSVLLIICTFISIAFSYTGMCISNLSPIDQYERTYYAFLTEFEFAKKELIASTPTDEMIDQKINQFFGQVDQAIASCDYEITSIDTTIKTNNEIIGSDSSSIRNKSHNNNNNTTTITTSSGQSTVIANQNISDLSNKKSKLESYKNDLVNISSSFTAQTVISFIKDPEKSNINSQKLTQFISAFNSVNELLSTPVVENRIPDSFINDLQTNYQNYINIKDITLAPSSYFSSKIEEENPEKDNSTWKHLFAKFMNMIFTDSSSASASRKCLKETQKNIDTAYGELKQYFINSPPSNISELKSSIKEIHSYGDPNLQAFLYLFDPKFQNKSISIFVMAVLIDSLTCLFGVMGKKKMLSLLTASSNKDFIDNEEDLFSMIFISLISTKPFNTISDNTNFEQRCIDYVQSIEKIIYDFLAFFRISPWTIEHGFGLYAQYSNLKDNQTFIPLITLLIQLGYLKLISKPDFEILQQHFDGTLTSEYTPSSASESEYICLLRFRVHLYLRHGCADINFTNINPLFNFTKEDD